MRRRVTFTAGEKEYSLRFGTNAMARYEEISGERAGTALKRLDVGDAELPPIAVLRNLFRATLEQEVSAAEAGDIMDDLGLQRAVEVFGEAVKLAFPDAAANPQTPRETTTAPTP